MSKIKEADNIKGGRDNEQLQYLYILGGNRCWNITTSENSLTVSNKIRYISTYTYLWLANYTPKYLFKGYKCVCPPSDLHKNIPVEDWQHPDVCQEGNKHCGHIFATCYYTAIKKNELLIHTTWTDLENVTLSKKSQIQRSAHTVWFHSNV